MECQYCHNIFSSKSVLFNHQKTAKYCLSVRDDKSNIIEIKCKGCGKTFTRRSSLDRHTENCTIINHTTTLEKNYNILQKELEYKNRYIEKLEKITKELQDKLENIAISAVSRPTTITTNNTHNQNNILLNLTPFDMNKEKFAEKINEHFNKNYLLNGQKGVAQFVVENILKDEEGKLMYICTDPSRQIYRFKGVDGFIERDVKAKKLTNALYEQIRSKSHSISSEEMEGNDSDTFLLYSGRFQDIKELEDDNSEFSIELAILTTR